MRCHGRARPSVGLALVRDFVPLHTSHCVTYVSHVYCAVFASSGEAFTLLPIPCAMALGVVFCVCGFRQQRPIPSAPCSADQH